MAQSAGLRIGAFDDIAEFQEFESTSLKPTLTNACRHCWWLAERQRNWSLAFWGWMTLMGWKRAYNIQIWQPDTGHLVRTALI